MTYYDLGKFTWPVTTHVREAQIWANRGILWTFGFNHEEAIVCFDKAIQQDPECAMAYWGKAYAAGPNYNMPWDLYDEDGRAEALAKAYDAAQLAMAHIADATPVEAALIKALKHRYPQRMPGPEMSKWDDAFAAHMREVQQVYPDDLNVLTVTVEAMMQRTPWTLWDIYKGAPMPGADTVLAQSLIENALRDHADAYAHPGLLHLYVHLMEMSPTPEKALKAADVLRRIVPDAGHLVHMGSHIDVQCGAYHDTVFWNERAVEADLKYYAIEGAVNVYTGYRQHNYHFVIAGAMFLGQLEPARQALKGLKDTTPEAFLRIKSPPIADFYESYLAFEPHVLVRFGRWHEAIALPLPEDPDLYCTQTAYVHYARAVAHAALGDVPNALKEEQLFLSAADRVPESRLSHNVRIVDLLDIARNMARGEILYRQADYPAAFKALRQCVALEDALAYDEPWGWMMPSRHALGALLFEQGHVQEAEQVFREDLGFGGTLPRAQVHPDNVWALRGLADCLLARGDTVELPHVRAKLDIALARADGAVAASCFCAQSAMQASPSCCD